MSTAIQLPLRRWRLVLLNAKHIKTERLVKSLDHKNMGPYQITRVIDNMAYELDLPESLKNIFPAFHPWLLQPYEDDALPGQPRANDHAPPEVHLNDEGDTEYVIAQVLDSRIRNTMNDPHTSRRGCLQYKVEWVGDDQSKCWQPYFNQQGVSSRLSRPQPWAPWASRHLSRL
ncbi:hypothetical protein P3342_004996 [Pyrenophora teres f. teres]|nr:hypothetical protein P3342_004996 [Pyrenophora teres f. teres]